jgi:hypothetical protein
MSSLDSQPKFCGSIVFILMCSTISLAQDVRFKPVPREIVESRLGKYAGKDSQREMTLKQMFAEAGCDDQQLAERIVKGSKVPSVICVLPGTSDRTIIVGAHFDCESQGMAFMDNSSGASLLPCTRQQKVHRENMHTFSLGSPRKSVAKLDLASTLGR